MGETLLYLATSFWYGAVHAATPGHGKTIAAAYIVGARGRPVDAWVLGIFVTLSHTSGIVLVGVLASLGLPGFVPQRLEAWMALATGLLIILIGAWTLWTQRALFAQAGWSSAGTLAEPAPSAAAANLHYRSVPAGYAHVHAAHDHDHAHGHDHTHDPGHTHAHGHEHSATQADSGEAGYHSHGWGFRHTHDLTLVTSRRPSLWLLLGLGVAGGLVPDPIALGILLNLLAQGKMMLGLGTVLVFSVGFAAVLVVVGVVAAKVGPKILDWLSGMWAARVQLATSLLIILVGVVLTAKAWTMLARLA
jgi:nickel/cobalt transporter (NicO) family protein